MNQNEAITKAVEALAQALWGLLDDIDTLDDACRDDDKAFRDAVRKVQRRRFEFGSTDGHTVTFPALSALQEQPVLATHRHKRRGKAYMLIGYGKMQCDWWQIIGAGLRYPVDMREVAIYRSVDDDSLWVCPRDEFEDSRFEVLSALQPFPEATDKYEAAKRKVWGGAPTAAGEIIGEKP